MQCPNVIAEQIGFKRGFNALCDITTNDIDRHGSGTCADVDIGTFTQMLK